MREHQPGSRGDAIEKLTRYMDNPNKPMVDPGIVTKLATTRNMQVTPMQMFADDGHKVRAVQYLAARAAAGVSPAREPEDVYEQLQTYLEWSVENSVPVTYPAFALWCGVTAIRLDQIIRDKTDRPRAEAFMLAKETLRAFLDFCAAQGSVNLLYFFHTHKSIFGAVENQQVTVRVEDNTTEISQDEYAERVVQLVQGEDGVYRESDEG